MLMIFAKRKDTVNELFIVKTGVKSGSSDQTAINHLPSGARSSLNEL